jgi:hypothetical protein
MATIAGMREREMRYMFSRSPRAGAEYLGRIAKISVSVGNAADAGHRATLAAHFASIFLASYFVGVELAAAMAGPDIESDT